MTYKNFCAIYPNYLDSEKTVKLGRRISTKDAVPEPTIQDIHEALVLLDVRHVIQPHKGYSRDGSSRWDNPGRVLVDLDGAISTGVLEMSINGGYDMDDAIPEMGDDDDGDQDKTIEGKKGRGKKHLLRQLAQVMSGLPNRQNRLSEKRKMLEEKQLKASKPEKNVTTTGGETSGASGNRKKKGKKKK
jgi:signal recognition particle subunit SRP19